MLSLPKIAFVDDEKRVLAGLKRRLRGQMTHWEMSFFDSPVDALDAFRKNEPTVAVVDIRMPDMNGIELARKIREYGHNTVCIILSGSTDFNLAVSSINDANIFRYYVKPCPVEELTCGITEAIEHQRERFLPLNAETPEPKPGGSLAAISTTGLELIPYGVVVCNTDGKAIFVNSRASRILGNEESLSLDTEHRLRAGYVEETQKLRNAISEAREESAMTALTLGADSEQPLRVTVQPFDDKNGAMPGHVGLFVFSESEVSMPAPKLLMEMFGLTISESRLTSQLSKGLSIEEAAAECGITKSSARTYLKSIFMKVGVSRQAELVRTVLVSLATH